jgi:REP element-mobilizing transposase RayT
MARKPRVHFPNAFYHVIARGNQRQDLFLDGEDYQVYLSYLSQYKVQYQFHVYAYALMKNHVHLLLEVGETPLSRLMQVLQFRYARYFNRRYGKVGHLFQGRYKAILCERDSYLLELIRYIHLNPVRSRAVKDLEKYRWTSHLNYLGRVRDGLIDEGLILIQFGRSRAIAQRRYREFVLAGLNLGHQRRFYEVKDQRFLGGDDFIERLESRRVGERPVQFDIPMEEIVEEVCRQTGVSQEQIYSLSRDRRGAYGRAVVAYLARKLSGYLVKEIGGFLGREPMTISEATIRLENRIQEDEELSKRIYVLEGRLTKGKKKKYLISVA